MSEDSLILEMIDAMDEESLLTFDALIPDDLDHYLVLQRKWVCDARHFLKENTKREPCDLEVIADINRTKTFERFCVYYAIKYYDRVFMNGRAESHTPKDTAA